MTRVTVWNEFIHEKEKEAVKKIYPDGIHTCIASFLNQEQDIRAKTAVLAQPEHGLTEEVLASTDVLIWWGHCAHAKVSDDIVKRVHEAVLRGMGLIVLHSGHKSKIFQAVTGTSCCLKWRDDDYERVWTVNPAHPIAQGVPETFVLEQEEMYGEPFDIPTPQDVVFMGWFKGGEVFRSGVTYQRGLGRVFYFQPGHESFPTYHNEIIQTIIKNAVRWAKPVQRANALECPNAKPLES